MRPGVCFVFHLFIYLFIEFCSPPARQQPFYSFLHLDYYRQVSLARTFGWTREQILADLIYLEMPAELLVPVF